MNTIDQLCDELLRTPLARARAAARDGTRVIGVLGPDVPVELILAAGAFPAPLPAFADHPTPRADLYLEAGFLPALRSIAEQWLCGAFDFMEAVVFTRADDSIQRLYYYLCELQRRGLAKGPQPLLYDLAKIPRASSAAHSLAATWHLARTLGTLGEALPAAIARQSLWQTRLQQLQQRRCGPAPPPGDWVQRIVRAGAYANLEELGSALQAALALPGPQWSGPRVLLVGSRPPDERLHVAVAGAGGRVVAEVGDHALASGPAPIAPGEDPVAALAMRAHTQPTGPRSWHDRIAAVAESAGACAADAVVFWLIEEDESWAWEIPALRTALAARGLPVLELTRCRWDASDEAPRRIEGFVRSMVAMQ